MAKKILIVDDDSDIREATEMVLVAAGYDVLHAASRAEAEKVLAEQSDQVGLILLDVMMETETEGFHLAYKLRADERYKPIPIVILTCIEETTGETIQPEQSGDYLPVDAYLRKPLDAEQLKATVAQLIR